MGPPSEQNFKKKEKEALQSEVGCVVEHYGEVKVAWERRGVLVVVVVVVVQGRCRGVEADHITGKPRGVTMSGKHLKSCMRQLVTDLTWEGATCAAWQDAGLRILT